MSGAFVRSIFFHYILEYFRGDNLSSCFSVLCGILIAMRSNSLVVIAISSNIKLSLASAWFGVYVYSIFCLLFLRPWWGLRLDLGRLKFVSQLSLTSWQSYLFLFPSESSYCTHSPSGRAVYNVSPRLTLSWCSKSSSIPVSLGMEFPGCYRSV